MARANAIKGVAPNLSGEGLAIGVVMSRFNQDIVEGLRDACIGELKKLGVAEQSIYVVAVPGAMEIPLTLQALALTRKYDALVALGCVIRGETYHFEVVSNESSRGVTDVQLETGVPIANAILTVENDAQARVRINEKGADAARVAVEMARALSNIAADHRY